MKNKFFKSLALALSFATVLGTLPVNAYELDSQGMSIENVEYQNSTDEDFTNLAEVFAEIGSTYQVTIPKVIVLSGESKSAQYQVSVEGDIAGCETIFVKPDSFVNLFAVNKEVQVGAITQDKIGWTNNTIDVIGNGLIKADGITAGRWSGTFNFEIFLNKVLGDVIAPDHIHVAGEAQIENVIQPDCLNSGSYDEAVYCTDCYEELSRETKEIPALGHDYVEGVCTRCNDTLPDLVVSATGFDGHYNAKPHGITVVSEGNTIEYSVDGINYTSENPQFEEEGTYEVYYKVSKENYKTVYGKETVVIAESILPDSFPSFTNRFKTVTKSNTISYYDSHIYLETTAGDERSIKNEIVSTETFLSNSVDKITITARMQAYGNLDSYSCNSSQGIYIQESDDGENWTTFGSMGKSVSWSPSSYHYNTTLTQTFDRPNKKYFRFVAVTQAQGRLGWSVSIMDIQSITFE